MDTQITTCPTRNQSPSILDDATDLRIVRFHDRLLTETRKPYRHYVPLQKEQFGQRIYQAHGWASRTQMNRLYDNSCFTAKDLSQNSHYIVFGNTVWDTERLTMRNDISPADCVWHSPYSLASSNHAPVPLVMDFAGDDQGLYDDIMQSIAPLVMANKPEGIIWWLGDNTAGMSALAEALHHLFPGQLATLSMKQLSGRQVLPELNKVIGNVAAEISDGRVVDTDIYKSLASHDDFSVHRYHSQSGLTIHGNVHHIFTTTKRPTFTTVNHAVLRRTIIIPIASPMASSLTYRHQSISDAVLKQLATEILNYAKRIKRQGGRYEWSPATSLQQSRT